MSTALTTNERKELKTLLHNYTKNVASVLPRHIKPEKMLQLAYNAIVLNPALGRCIANIAGKLSLINALIEASALGLEIGGPLAQAHMVPFKGKIKLIVDYKGLIELGYRSPAVASITARPVYERDEFNYSYGLNDTLVHVPFKNGDRGKLDAAYAIIKYVNGGIDFEVVEREDAMAAREYSSNKNSDDSPWNKPAEEPAMWVKTAVRKLSKRTPKNPELQRALKLESNTDENQGLNHVFEADFKTITDPPANEKPPENKEPEPDKKTPPGPLSEEQKIINNFEVARDSFPQEYETAVKELKINGEISIENMTAIMKRISTMLDQEAV